jgi:hypothetical protein
MTRSAGGRSVKLFAAEGIVLEEPIRLVAITVNVPLAEALNFTPSVADVPPALMDTVFTVIAAGLKVGTNEKLAPVRFEPLTEIVVVLGTVYS